MLIFQIITCFHEREGDIIQPDKHYIKKIRKIMIIKRLENAI